MDGLLVVDKPAGPTSHDVVARMRRVLGEPRIGHTGTLDPAATGVLPLVLGRATRLAQFLSGSDKEYEAVVALGARTTTCDAEGDAVGERWTGPLPSREAIERALDTFRGTFEQTPPVFSAKKIGGVRSYARARAAAREAGPGAAPPAPRPVRVTLHAAEIVGVAAERVTIRLVSSAGFYVRSLACDLGERLGVGGHLVALRRLRSGEYGLDSAITLGDAERSAAAAAAAVIPLDRLLTGWPSLVLTDRGARQVAFGRDVGPGDAETAIPAGDRVRLLDATGRLLALAERASPGVLHPAVVFV